MNPRRHSSIRRLLAVFGTLAGLILLVSLLSLTLSDWERATRSHKRDLTSGYRFAQALIESRLATARLLAEQAALQPQLPANAVGQATFLTVGQDGPSLEGPSAGSLRRLPTLAGRLSPAPAAAVEVDSEGRLVAVGTAPAGDGHVIAAIPFTPADVEAIKDATGLESSLYAGQARVATTLRRPDGRPPTATLSPVALLAGLDSPVAEPRWTSEPDLQGQSFLEIRAPLCGLDGSVVGALALSRPWAGYWTWLLPRIWPQLGIPLAGAGLIALLTAWLTRRLEGSHRQLQLDLGTLAAKQEASPLTADYGLSELDRLAEHANQLHAARTALAHNNERLDERLIHIQTLAVLGQLAAGVAHDLNNPLTTIMGLADIVLSSDSDPDTQRDVAVIYRQAERSGSIVRSLLSFARRHRDDPQWVSLNELISQTLELLAYQARISHIRCQAHLAKDLPLTWADPSQLQQVLFNLLINALQAMAAAHGRGRLRVESTLSPPATDAPHGRLMIRVRDDGPGIPDDVLPRLFRPYFTTKEPDGGTGLGLSIASDIAKRHGGRIWAENNPHGGACFTVQLPVSLEPADQAATPVGGTHPPTTPCRILLADSDPQCLALLAKLLRRQGYQLLTAGDGLLARSRIELEALDLVICGLEMLRLDGRELHAWARNHRPDLARRFIFLVAGEMTPEVERFLQDAHAWVLAPPFQEEGIRSVVNQALR